MSTYDEIKDMEPTLEDLMSVSVPELVDFYDTSWAIDLE